eukprot:scaffold114900_cov72-Phaeocystis_antarctica.AAC.1
MLEDTKPRRREYRGKVSSRTDTGSLNQERNPGETRVPADTSTASTPVSNRQSPALPLGWAAGGMRDEATSMATWGIRFMH